jgi:hypothetical protein
MREFLKAVDSGKTGFEATSESVSDLTAFQSTAKIAQEAYDLSYIDFFKPHQESYSAHGFIDAVLASGLTDAGREYLGNL